MLLSFNNLTNSQISLVEQTDQLISFHLANIRLNRLGSLLLSNLLLSLLGNIISLSYNRFKVSNFVLNEFKSFREILHFYKLIKINYLFNNQFVLELEVNGWVD
jgi:hypothetical protein